MIGVERFIFSPKTNFPCSIPNGKGIMVTELTVPYRHFSPDAFRPFDLILFFLSLSFFFSFCIPVFSAMWIHLREKDIWLNIFMILGYSFWLFIRFGSTFWFLLCLTRINKKITCLCSCSQNTVPRWSHLAITFVKIVKPNFSPNFCPYIAMMVWNMDNCFPHFSLNPQNLFATHPYCFIQNYIPKKMYILPKFITFSSLLSWLEIWKRSY